MNSPLFIPCRAGLALLCLAGTGLPAQTFEADSAVTVTASRLSLPAVSAVREIRVLDFDRPGGPPAASAADALRLGSGVELRPRGAASVQTDFSLRGSSFEGVLVLVDGVPVNDPQTGHHNSDLPVPVLDVARIEVLHGPASALYGASGFGGAVNVITRSGSPRGAAARFRASSFGGLSASASRSASSGRWSGRFGAEKSMSRGWRDDTDYDVSTLFHRSSVKWGPRALDASVAWTRKDFGANGFYAAYPSREKTETFQASGRMGWQLSPSASFTGSAFVRAHRDIFVLDGDRPDWFRSRHRSVAAGAEASFHRRWNADREAVLGAEIRSQGIESTALGNREEGKAAVFFEAATRLPGSVLAVAGARMDGQTGLPPVACPSLALRGRLSGPLAWRAAAGRAYRAPNFTERFYVSPANVGDPGLEPETAWSVETGGDLTIRPLTASATVFFRAERNRIDWLSDSEKGPWKASNLGPTEVYGFSLHAEGRKAAGRQAAGRQAEGRKAADPTDAGPSEVNAHARIPGSLAWRIAYTWLSPDRGGIPGLLSKYGINTLRHLASAGAEIGLTRSVEAGVSSEFRVRDAEGSALFLNARLSRVFGPFFVSLESENILDKIYEDIPGVPCPGRSWGVSVFWDGN